MAEYGIIMRPESIRAYQAGRKTQTRRVARWPLKSRSDGSKQRLFGEGDVEEINELLSKPQRHPLSKIMAPHGLVGDRLIFRENYWVVELPGEGIGVPFLVFDDEWQEGVPCPAAERPWQGKTQRFGRHSCIHMPRWAARYTPPVTSLRIERLQEIDNEDAVEEGMRLKELIYRDGDAYHNARRERIYSRFGEKVGETKACGAREIFAYHWNCINGKRAPWESNPWVWVYGFPRYEGTG